MPIEFEEVTVTAITPKNSVVSWALVPTIEPLGQWRFDVQRSYAPQSGFETEVEGLRNQFYWIDSNPAVLSKWETTYYRIRAYQVDAAGDEVPNTEVLSHPGTLNDRLSPKVLHIIRNKQIVYRQLGIGRESLVYKRRESGQRCPQCWDEIEQRVTTQECPVCYGTGFLGGFYPPIKVLVRYLPTTKQNTVGTQLQEYAYCSARVANYPKLEPRDVIYEIGQGRWWMVNVVQPTESERILVSQFLQLHLLDPQNTEHDLPVPTLDSEETIDALWLIGAQ